MKEGNNMSKVSLEKVYKVNLNKQRIDKKFKSSTFFFNKQPHKIENNRMVPVLIEPKEIRGEQ